MVSFQMPATTEMLSPSPKSTETFSILMPRGFISASVRGTGLLPGPTKPQILEVRVPLQDVVELKNGARKTVQKKMFPGYVLQPTAS